jgi:hypothetical protein
MMRLGIALLILGMLGACGGTHCKKKCCDSAPPDAGYDDPGYFDTGYEDPGYDDPGSGDSGAYDDSGDSGSDGSEKAVSLPAPPVTVEAFNYDAASYTLYVEAEDPRGKRVNLYFPPMAGAPPGRYSQTSRTLRLRQGFVYSIVLEDPDGRRLDRRALGLADGAARSGVSVVGATLLDTNR